MSAVMIKAIGITRPAVWTPSCLQTFPCYRGRQNSSAAWARAIRNPRTRPNTTTPSLAKPANHACYTTKQPWNHVMPLLQSTTTRPASAEPSGIIPSSSRYFSHSCTSQVTKAQYENLKQDPSAMRAHLDWVSAWKKKYYASNPEARERQRLSKKGDWESRWAKGDYHLSVSLNRWVREYTWVRTSLPWKTHQPIISEKPVEHYCKGCGVRRRGGLTLWWKQKENDGQAKGEDEGDDKGRIEDGNYLCHSCYVPKDKPQSALPQGYETITNYHQLLARKKALDGPDSVSGAKMDEPRLRSKILWAWCQRLWVRQLPWKTHQPLLFENKAQFQCASCDRARIRPVKLWWREIAEHQETVQTTDTKHICHHCYTRPDWTEIMPRGYEDVRRLNQFMARKKQLDEQAM